MKRICTVCARGGSKGVPEKNLAEIAGKPLLVHTVERAVESGLFDVIVVSSDDQRIVDAGMAAGADEAVIRPLQLASDESAKVDAIRHAVLEVEGRRDERYDTVVDLDATAPLRSVGDIEGAIAMLEDSGAHNVISGSLARKSPYFNVVERRPDGSVSLSKTPATNVVRRQDAPEAFDLNGSVYAWRRDAIVDEPAVFYGDTLLFEMPPERSIDIDSPLDFALVEQLLMERVR